MLGDIELQLVQEIEVDCDQILFSHSVPALECIMFQDSVSAPSSPDPER